MKKIQSNEQHPELLEGEMFVGNVIPTGGFFEPELSVVFKSFRKGEVAYNIIGEHDKSMSGYKPGFVNKKDFIDNFNKLSIETSKAYAKYLDKLKGDSANESK